MLLVIDAGNSSISLGLFETPDVGAPDGNTPGGRPALLWNVKIAADPQRSADEYRLTLGLLLRDGGYSPADVDAVALGSVVPALTHTLREALGRLCRGSDGTPGSASHGKCRNTHGACPSGRRPRPAGRRYRDRRRRSRLAVRNPGRGTGLRNSDRAVLRGCQPHVAGRLHRTGDANLARRSARCGGSHTARGTPRTGECAGTQHCRFGPCRGCVRNGGDGGRTCRAHPA